MQVLLCSAAAVLGAVLGIVSLFALENLALVLARPVLRLFSHEDLDNARWMPLVIFSTVVPSGALLGATTAAAILYFSSGHPGVGGSMCLAGGIVSLVLFAAMLVKPLLEGSFGCLLIPLCPWLGMPIWWASALIVVGRHR